MRDKKEPVLEPWLKPLSKPIAVPKPAPKKKKGRFDKGIKDEV